MYKLKEKIKKTSFYFLYKRLNNYKGRIKAGLIYKSFEKNGQKLKFNNYKYDDIYELLYINQEKYKLLLSAAFENKLEELRKRLKNQKKIKVGFLVYSSAIWQYDSIYKLMDKSELFEVLIILCTIAEDNKRLAFEQYQMAKEWFAERNYNLLCANDLNRKHSKLEWSSLKLDVIFGAIPYGVNPRELCIWNARLNSLICYAPYGVAINEMNARYFDLKIHNIAWKLFYETSLQKEIARDYAKNKGENVEISGYLKMDCVFDGSIKEDFIWKEPNEKRLKRIIFAPHHSLMRDKSQFSTFHQNYKFFLEFARTHQDTTSWVFKPHPLLKREAIEYGLLTEQEYEEYVMGWDKLKNSKVVLKGDYMPIFKTSDCLILDSESFLFEYQYFQKPILFLRRDTQTFNVFGKKLLKVVYKVKGNDYDGIRDFIEQVVIGENDAKSTERKEFYDQYLNYYKINGGLASKYVFDSILSQVLGVNIEN